MICSKDDSGVCCGVCDYKTPTGYDVIAVIPCFGRFPLLDQTVSRLVNKNKVKVILVGDEKGVADIASKYNQEFCSYPNTTLGAKWNFGFQAARKHNPKAVLFVGSSDWVEDDFMLKTLPFLETHEMVGTLGCYLLDIHTTRGKRLVHWPGYGKGPRAHEPIGIGRVISRSALDKMNWEPFDPQRQNSMDWTMYNKVLQNGGQIKIVDAKSMAISTNLWLNKHQFEEHWKGRMPSERMAPDEFISNYFPEANKIHGT
jgi:hypothetical protein